MELRIAFITNKFPEVSETFIVRQATELNAHVVASSLNEKAFEFYDFDYSKVFGLGTERQDQKSFYDKAFNAIIQRPYKAWPKSFYSKLERYFKKNKIDVVLAAFGTNGINVLPVCKKLDIPLVIQFLGYDASSLIRSKSYCRKIKQALEYASSAIVLYSGMEKPFIDLGIEPSKFHVINVGVPVEDFIRGDKTNGIVKFLSVGRFVEKKAPINTLRAFLLSADVNPFIELNMVGEGPLLAEAQILAEKSAHKSKINFLGNLSQSELSPLYQKSDIFLQHSVTARDGNTEGWPVSIAEACASGLPIISTKHAGIVDQVIHQKTGFLVDEHDILQMSKHMIELSQNNDLCISMGAASRCHIESHGNLHLQLIALRKLMNNTCK